MGITRFSGPVYGTKSLIFVAHQEAGIVSTSPQTIGQLVVPIYQDLFITELHGMKQSTGSTSLTFALSDDSTRVNAASTRTLATVAITSSLANTVGSTTPAADAGEYEGVRVAGGSTLTLQLLQPLSSAAALFSSGLQAWVYGYIRYLDSTRAV